MKILKQQDIEAIQEESYRKGFEEAVEFTIKELVQSNVIVYDRQGGYGTCLKVPIDLANQQQIMSLVFEIVAKSVIGDEAMQETAKGYMSLVLS